jgi:hypothetical protein
MFGDKCQQSSATTTTGPFQVTTNVGAFKSWRSQKADGESVFYYAENADATIWEEGFGVLAYGAPDTITRTVLQSSTGGLVDWSGITVYIFSAPVARAMEGRYDSGNAFFVPRGRQPYTAKGAANYAILAADVAGRFSFDNSAATRTATLPLISAVYMGFSVELIGLSQAGLGYLAVAPAGTDIIDYAGAGATVTFPGKKPVRIWSDGAQWRTDFAYGQWYTLGVVNLAAVANGDVTGIPAGVKDIRGNIEAKPNTDAVSISLQTYGADGVLDVGASDYDWGIININNAAVGGGLTTSILLTNGASVDNGTNRAFAAKFEADNIQNATYTKFLWHADYLDSAGATLIGNVGHGARQEADRITGVRGLVSSGNMTGRLVVEGFFQ